ncbi:type I polyketide synthase, partial [Streptomyces sp. MBT65]|uniref:type I polyketide synthase n=1 Tax=Streptomyces sp. MBT65 TaxID=1488395 RepID=UPI00190CD2B5
MTRDRSLDIAVTGVSARFPGAPDLDAWWTALTEGRVLTRRYETSDLLAAGVPKDLLDDPAYVPVYGHLPDADRFDNALFGVSPREAQLMDPQHRLLLEAAWAALEDAGVAPRGRVAGAPRTAVFASASGSGYLRAMVAGGQLDPLTVEDAIHGTEPDFMASLLSYKLDLTGPAVAVQTACSSSLVALHMAVQSLLNGDCDQALVAAAGIAYPQAGHLAVAGGIHSSSGACRPFDEHADGVVAGGGVACVVLRRLADAEADGCDPYGVVLGTAINNDGAAKAGYYAPSVGGQEAVIRAALSTADVGGDTIGYLETHGTGTRVGDPIEWSAATAALSGAGAPEGSVAVGALKANVGHLDNAAGLAALIKALLVVKTGVVPPVAGFTRLNPLLETAGSPLYVPTECGPWTGPEPRRAGVSSFGIGGTNVHVVVEQPPATDPLDRSTARLDARLADGGADLADVEQPPAAPAGPARLERSTARLGTELADGDTDLTDVEQPPTTPADPEPEDRTRLVLLSAADTGALDRSTTRLADGSPDPADVEQPPTTPADPKPDDRTKLVLLSAADAGALERSAARLSARLADGGIDLADVAATLAAGRAELPERLAVTGRSAAEVALRLTRNTAVVRGSRPARGPAPVVFAFPGQGTQYPGMALPAAEALPGFPAALEECLAAFGPALAGRMRGALLDPGFPAAELTATELVQPVLFAFEYAAATALTALGVRPAAVAGHSLGEITAACVAGILDLPDAARLVTARGQAMQECPEGAMLALGCAEEHARELIAVSGLPGLEPAAVNSPDSCVVAGPVEAVTEFEARLAGRIPLRRLAANRAFHSALVEPALPRLTDTLAGLTVRRPAVSFAANVTGRLFPPDSEIRPRLFVEQARRTVRFGDALASIAEHLPDALVVEVGPGQVLSALAETAGLSVVPLSPSRTAHPADEVLTALGTLWTQGQPLSPRALCEPGHRKVHLPSYPFAGPRWIAPEAAPRTDAARSVQPVGETTRTQADGPGPIAPLTPAALHTGPPPNATPFAEATGGAISALHGGLDAERAYLAGELSGTPELRRPPGEAGDAADAATPVVTGPPQDPTTLH